MSTINTIAISIIMMATVLVYSAKLVTWCLLGLWYGFTDMIYWVLCHEHCYFHKVHYIIELPSVPDWSSWLKFLIEAPDWSSCNSSATLTPSRIHSRAGYRVQFNKFVELSTLTPSRIVCRAPRCGQRIAGINATHDNYSGWTNILLGGRRSLLCFVISPFHCEITRNRRMRSSCGNIYSSHISSQNTSFTWQYPFPEQHLS